MFFRKDRLLEYFFYRHKEEILRDLAGYPEHIRALETFPGDQIIDFLEILNSNIIMALLFRYDTKLVKIIEKELETDRFKVDPATLQRPAEEAPAEEEKQ